MMELQSLILRELAGVWRHRWFAVGFAWLFCALGWAGVALIPNQYEASARLFVDSDAVLTPLLKGIAVDTQVASQLDVLQRTLLSRPNLEDLIAKTDLELGINGAGALEQLVARLSTDIKVVPQTHDLFTITYRNPSPHLAYDVVRTILTTFVESTTGNDQADMENARQFLEKQIGHYEGQLRDAENKRADFHAKYVDLLPSDGNVGSPRLEGAQVMVRTLQGALIDAQAKGGTLATELAITPPLLVTESDVGGYGPSSTSASPLADAQRQLAELQLRYTEQHPDVVAALARVAALKAGGGSGGGNIASPGHPVRNRSAPNPVYEQLKVGMIENNSVIASLQRQVGDATAERDRLEATARGAPGLQAEYVNLNRDYDVVRKNYEELLARRESMRIAAAAAGSEKVKLRIVDPPQVPRLPVAPKRALMLSGVLLAGLAGGVGVAVLLTRLGTSFNTAHGLRALQLPVVGSVSILVVATSWRRRVAAAVPVAMLLVLLGATFGVLLRAVLKTVGAA